MRLTTMRIFPNPGLRRARNPEGASALRLRHRRRPGGWKYRHDFGSNPQRLRSCAGQSRGAPRGGHGAELPLLTVELEKTEAQKSSCAVLNRTGRGLGVV